MIYKCLIVACFIIFYFILFLPPFFSPSNAAEETVNADDGYYSFKAEKPFFLNQPFPELLKIYRPTKWWVKQNKVKPQQFPIFQLSQNYPKNLPVIQKRPWQEDEFNIIFDTKVPAKDRWGKYGRRYLVEVLKYAFDENIILGGDIENDWNQTNKKTPKWFHAPWLHADKTADPKPRGREFVHGLTKERCTCKEELAGKGECKIEPDPISGFDNQACHDKYGNIQKENIQNWGVAVFNDLGGYNIGRIWQEMTIHKNNNALFPDPAKFHNMDFPDGTVIVKLLFTAATDEEAPFLENSKLVWRTDINRVRKNSGKLEDKLENFPTLRLLQIDVSVRDKRADKYSGWVFGTFTYNAGPNFNISNELKKSYKGWENVEPLGLMFGNDPRVKMTGFENLQESLINEKVIGRYHHLGCGERLNGTVDNPKSSCIACHAQGAEVQSLVADKSAFGIIKYAKEVPTCDNSTGELNSDDLTYWFRNILPKQEDGSLAQTFTQKTDDDEYYPLHNVLQLQIGITRFCDKFPKNCNRKETLNKLKKNGLKYPTMKEATRGID